MASPSTKTIMRSLDGTTLVAHSPSIRLGAALLNEVFWWDARAELAGITTPTLIVHGTNDTFIPCSRHGPPWRHWAVRTGCSRWRARSTASPRDDPGYRDPRTRQWQASVIEETAAWLRR